LLLRGATRCSSGHWRSRRKDSAPKNPALSQYLAAGGDSEAARSPRRASVARFISAMPGRDVGLAYLKFPIDQFWPQMPRRILRHPSAPRPVSARSRRTETFACRSQRHAAIGVAGHIFGDFHPPARFACPEPSGVISWTHRVRERFFQARHRSLSSTARKRVRWCGLLPSAATHATGPLHALSDIAATGTLDLASSRRLVACTSGGQRLSS
jgi:hypothetical protein